MYTTNGYALKFVDDIHHFVPVWMKGEFSSEDANKLVLLRKCGFAPISVGVFYCCGYCVSKLIESDVPYFFFREIAAQLVATTADEGTLIGNGDR